MKKIFLLLFLFSASAKLFSQQGKDGAGVVNAAGTIVNNYTTLTADATGHASSITVASSASFTAGDLILIIQMQGASVNCYNGGSTPPWYDTQSAQPQDTSYGRVTAYNGAGNNEFAEISSISGNTLTLNCTLDSNYYVAGKTQVVRVPRYTSLTIGASGVITCPHWDRSNGYGGVIAIEVHGNTTIASGGKIDASGLGFRGGAFWFKSASNPGGSQWGCLYTNEGAYKGESIAGDTNVYVGMASKFGKGSIANGGGGGNNINGGGGGGANAGTLSAWRGSGNPDATYNTTWALESPAIAASSSGGGRGGYTFSSSTSSPNSVAPGSGSWGGDNRRIQGGLGGRPLNYSSGQLYLGGGGGSGDGENFYQGAGGDGGGIIYFMSYGTISGAGQIVANGANGSPSITNVTRPGDGTNVVGRDGGGGGGGGGAIKIKSTGTVSGVTVSANGGNGGNNEMRNNGGLTAQAYGPGGGGGGGYIGLPTGTSVTTSVTGGTNGIVTYLSGLNNCQIDNLFPPNGATRGGAGVSSSNTTTFSITTNGATICSGQSAVLTASLNGTAPNPVTINWYSSSVGGSPIATGTSYTTTTLTSTTTFYVGTCPGIYREPVTVTITPAPAAPVVTSPVSACLNSTAPLLTATPSGSNTLLWWGTNSSGGTSSASAPTPSTSATGTTTYYVSQTNGSCEGPRGSIDVTILALPNPPSATSPVVYCLNETASALSATAGGGNSLLWWGTNASGGTSSATATVPSTNNTGSTTYYVSETNGTCESNRTPIIVTVNPLPAPPSVNDTVSYCQNETASQLTPAGAGINWYTQASGGSSIPAPTPNTSAVGTTTYYVSQTQNGCESQRDSVKVVINTSFLPPNVTNAVYCQGAVASDLSSNVSGTATLNWYTSASGGSPLATAPTPSTSSAGTVSYFVSQGSATCESNRAQIDVTINALPLPPATTSPVTYCLNETASVLTATGGAGNTLLWWTSASGGTSQASITPSTAVADTVRYYVSQSDGTCESQRDSIDVIVNALPSSPLVADTVIYCQNETATQLTPNGAGINWYTQASGGSSIIAPTPNTSAVGTTTYYVSQTVNGCESQRDSVKVIVNTSFLPPSVTNIAYCLGAVASDLSSNVSGTATLNWYTSPTGGSPSFTAPTPATSSAGTTSYFVSQGTATCESNRAQIDVTVHALPLAPAGTDVTYCLNETAVALTASGSGTLLWYNSATGGTSSPTAPVPGTASVGTSFYYVSQTDANTCESPRDTIAVTVINLQNAPSATNVAYCAGANAMPLTASGTTTLNWWGTNASGGTSSPLAPTPSTATAGTTTYYVSQGTGACESPRTPLTVTINPKPIISFTQNTNSVCSGDCVQFNENASAGCTNIKWDFGDGATSTTSGPTHCYTNAGIYDVKVVCTNVQGCTDSSVTAAAVAVNQAAVAQIGVSPGTTVSPGTIVSFMADTGSVQTAYFWNFNDPTSGTANTSFLYNPQHSFTAEGTYCVYLLAGIAPCTAEKTVCVEVIKEATIVIPNIFTPNGDGVNEQFTVVTNGLKDLEASIYDRWGIKLYSWNGTSGGWDGKGKSGNTVSDGVYYYIINTTDFKNETKQFSGYVQLINGK